MRQIELSIITPVYNGSEYISTYVQALRNLKLTNQVNLNVIIVDNGSADDSISRIRTSVKKGGLEAVNVEVFSYSEIQSSYAARNFGVQKNKSDYYIFTDIDCKINPDYLINLFQIISKSSYDIIAGDVKLVTDPSPNIYEIYDLVFGFNMKAYKDEETGITANLVVSDNCINNLGGFDSYISGADRNFCKKAKKEGYTFLFSENIVVDHPARNSFKDLYDKTVRIANGKARYVRNMKFGYKLKIVIKNMLSSVIQVHQFKMLFYNKDVYSEINSCDKIKLIALTFYLGVIGRMQINLNMFKS